MKPEIQKIIDDMELSELFGANPQQEIIITEIRARIKKPVVISKTQCFTPESDSTMITALHEHIAEINEPVFAEKATANPHDWAEAVKAVYKLKKEKGF